MRLYRRIIPELLDVSSGSSPQTLDPSSIGSGESFGNPQVNMWIQDPTSIGSAESFGTPQVNLSIDVSSIGSAESFGSPQVNMWIADAGGISSLEAFGTPVIGFVALPSGGNHEISEIIVRYNQDNNYILYSPPTGPATGGGGGQPISEIIIRYDWNNSAHLHPATGLQVIAPTSITSGEAFGTPVLTLYILPDGIGTAESVSSPQVNMTIAVGSIASEESFGTPNLAYTQTIILSSIPSEESVGTPAIYFVGSISVIDGIPSAEKFGYPKLIGGTTVYYVRRADDREITTPGFFYGAKEIGALRTPHSSTFANLDGSYTVFCQRGVNHLDASGDYSETDLRLVTTTEVGYSKQTQATPYSLLLKSTTAAALPIKASKDSYYINFEPVSLYWFTDELFEIYGELNSAVAATTVNTNAQDMVQRGQQIWYELFGQNTHFCVIPDVDCITKQLYLSKKRQPLGVIKYNSPDLAFKLKFTTNYKLRVDGIIWNPLTSNAEISTSAAIELLDVSNNLKAKLRIPVICDAAGNTTVGTYTLNKVGAIYYITINVDYGYLMAAQYPVCIDPDTYYGTNEDGFIQGSNVNYPTARETSTSFDNDQTQMIFGQRSSGQFFNIGRGFLEFDTSSIVDGSLIDQARMFVYPAGVNGSGDNSDIVHIYDVDWDSPITNANREANYDAVLTADFDAVLGVTGDFSQGQYFDSDELNVDYIDQGGITRYAIAHKGDYDGQFAGKNVACYMYTNESTSDKRPYLSITITDRVLRPESIPSEESFENDAYVSLRRLVPTSIPSEEHVSSDLVVRGPIQPVSIASVESFGTPTVLGAYIIPTSIPSAESVGTPAIMFPPHELSHLIIFNQSMNIHYKTNLSQLVTFQSFAKRVNKVNLSNLVTFTQTMLRVRIPNNSLTFGHAVTAQKQKPLSHTLTFGHSVTVKLTSKNEPVSQQLSFSHFVIAAKITAMTPFTYSPFNSDQGNGT